MKHSSVIYRRKMEETEKERETKSEWSKQAINARGVSRGESLKAKVDLETPLFSSISLSLSLSLSVFLFADGWYVLHNRYCLDVSRILYHAHLPLSLSRCHFLATVRLYTLFSLNEEPADPSR